MKRRDVIRGAAAAAAGGTALAGTTGSAAAAHTAEGYDLPIPNGVAVKHDPEGAKDMGWPHAYVATINVDDLCYWGQKSCTIGGGFAAALLRFLPVTAIRTAVLCGTTVAGCELRDAVQRVRGTNGEWADIYINYRIGNFLVLPRGL